MSRVSQKMLMDNVKTEALSAPHHRITYWALVDESLISQQLLHLSDFLPYSANRITDMTDQVCVSILQDNSDRKQGDLHAGY